MKFLDSLLRRRFARTQVATSRNVGYFLRLFSSWALVFNIACAAGAKREERGGGRGGLGSAGRERGTQGKGRMNSKI